MWLVVEKARGIVITRGLTWMKGEGNHRDREQGAGCGEEEKWSARKQGD